MTYGTNARAIETEASTMTPAEFRRLVGKHINTETKSNDAGLSTFARWLPVGPRSVMRWANDEIPVPAPVARLLQVIDKAAVDAATLKKVGALDA